jgi:flagellar P-ring protein precursor FlgI
MNKLLQLIAFCITISAVQLVSAERIKDISDIAGIRSNPLVGYGVVVGLNGSGEGKDISPLLRQLGIALPDDQLKMDNAAVVVIHAELPPFSKVGQKIDVTVSSLGEADELRGGTLLMAPLKGADGQVYAIAQGSLVVGGLGVKGADGSRLSINVPTVGRIPNGAMVERVVPNNFENKDHIVLNLHRPDFTTAMRVANRINRMVGPATAKPLDATSIRVSAPRDAAQKVSYLAALENLTVRQGDGPAKIVINSRTGTIVVGQHVRVSPAAITHGSLIVRVMKKKNVFQPEAFTNGQTEVAEETEIEFEEGDGKMFVLDTGVTLDQLVDAVNAIGSSPGDLMAILEALKEAGALHADLVVI